MPISAPSRLWLLSLVTWSLMPANASSEPMTYYSVGEIVCRQGGQSIIGSVELRDMQCEYRTSFGDRIATYMAQMTRRSSTPQIQLSSSLAWGVFATKTSISPGNLDGDFDPVASGSKVSDYVSKLGLKNSSNLQTFLQPRSTVINNDLVNLAKSVQRMELRTGR